MKVRSKLRFFVLIIAALFLVVLTILLVNSKSIRLSQQDRLYLQRFLDDWGIKELPGEVHKSFENELHFISVIQDSALASITGEQIPHAYFGDVSYYYKKRQGICYDRAVLVEKFLLLYQFQFRHVYIYFGNEK